MGLCAALISGCTGEEPAKPVTPAPTPAVAKKPEPGKMEPKTPPAPAPKTEEKK